MSVPDADRLSSLPDFAALQQLAKALHREPGERGAAVLVGAGFSKNALTLSTDIAPPPLWGELVGDMAIALYPPSGEGAPQDALRLAEEYRIHFGQVALDDFLRDNLPDAAWSPGPTHVALLELPWADVLTTNFDTLLERASLEVSTRNYQTVRTEGDLARFSAPRIIKLHGTIGLDDDLVLAEEDFRRYPTRRAAFVNSARQTFIENELCLFGFSGDDPNFLAWSGWVRDHLGGAARRIYLVGALNLSPSKRKLLEARNISPIDLWPLVEAIDPADHEARAVDIVLKYLAASAPVRPYEWRPTSIDPIKNFDAEKAERKDATLAAAKLLSLARSWRRDRQSYPGWLTTPGEVRRDLRVGLDTAPALTDAVEAELSAADRVLIAREWCWLHATAYSRMDRDLAVKLGHWCDEAEAKGLGRAECMGIATVLLREARYAGEDPTFDHWAGMIVRIAEPNSDDLAFLAYQRGLRARDRLDFVQVEALLDSIVGPDPAWHVRAAGLLAELGRAAEAKAKVSACVADLRSRRRTASKSVWIVSRLAWAEWIAAALERDATFQWAERDYAYLEWKTDPFEAIEGLYSQTRELASRAREKRREIILSFDEGQYRNPGKTFHFGQPPAASAFYKIRRLLEESGVPVRLRHFTLASEPFIDAGLLDEERGSDWTTLMLQGLGRADDSRYEDLFSRLAIARLDPEVSAEVLQRLYPAIEYWRSVWGAPERRGAALDHLPLLLETASRLAVRASATDAVAGLSGAFSLALDRKIDHHAVYEPLGRLIRNALRTLPKAARTPFMQNVLAFPLPGEVGGSAFRWPDASEWLNLIPIPIAPAQPEWDHLIDRLIATAGQDGKDRESASLRLAHISLGGGLSDDQAGRFGQALWALTDPIEPTLPSGTSLYPHMFAYLPHPPHIKARDRIQRRLFAILQPIGDGALHPAMSAAARPGPGGGRITPTPSEAVHLFDGLVVWRRHEPGSTAERLSAAFSGQSEDALARSLGSVFTAAIVPSMRGVDRTPERLQALLELLKDDEVGLGKGGLVWFAEGDQRDLVVQELRRGLLSRSFYPVAGATDAVQTWMREPSLGPPPALLLEQVLVLFEGGQGEAIHLMGRTLRKALVGGVLTDSQVARLRGGMDRATTQADYGRVVIGSREAVGVSLIRAECVRLAKTLDSLGMGSVETARWIDAARLDPLPEVRDTLGEHSAAYVDDSKDEDDD